MCRPPLASSIQLKPGSRIVLYDDLGKSYDYTITHQLWVTPDQVKYILPTGNERVTMVSPSLATRSWRPMARWST